MRIRLVTDAIRAPSELNLPTNIVEGTLQTHWDNENTRVIVVYAVVEPDENE